MLWSRWPGWIVAAACAASALVSAATLEIPVELKAAQKATQLKQSPTAINILQPLLAKYPKIADYTSWMLASAQFDLERYEDAAKTLDKLFTQSPPSPLVWRGALLAAKAYQLSGNPHAAVEILRRHYAKLPQPQGDLALATAFAADGDRVSAAVYDQRVYYSYPVASEAAQADTDLTHLRSDLGDNYPPVLGTVMLGRAIKLLEANQTERAKKELLDLLPRVGGAERDVVRVKIGAADYQRQLNAAARRYFQDLELEPGEADAERLFFLVQCARRLGDRATMHQLLDQLAKQYPSSPHRLNALYSTANSYLVENDSAHYEPLYTACQQDFRDDPRAPECHWKVTWTHYMHRQSDAADFLREQLKLFPASDEAPGALYYLGRLAEEAGDLSSARAYYSEVVREYPIHYYVTVARERLAGMANSAFVGPSQGNVFLKEIAFPSRMRTRNFDPGPTTAQRLERARMLASAELSEWAEIELRYAAQNEDQPHAIALELANMANRRDAPDQAIRFLKRYASDYLYLPVESAPQEFWKLAFPLPYRGDLERYSRQQKIDPFFFAALIRQESEFDAKATNSRSSARGLAQILPSTGKELSRRLQMKAYSTAALHRPAVNMQLGAYYLRTIADKLDGRWEAVLAAYNAGPSRAVQWLKWADFREPAEFMETIPFRETRNYVAVILRNADAYRRIYAKDNVFAAAEPSTQLSYSDGNDQPTKSSRPTGAR
ncbi:MAG: transglycosylase SLT domain-containing protein [Bryobacteraceae bacterium]